MCVQFYLAESVDFSLAVTSMELYPRKLGQLYR